MTAERGAGSPVPCDLWVGGSARYGVIDVATVRLRVHRLVWMQDHGPIPDGMVVMHTCDTPRCIEVTHLRLGTQQDNIDDMVAKARQRGGPGRPPRPTCGKGHPMTQGKTRQVCRECANDHSRRHRNRKKDQ